jgi:hypothetical protein
VNAVHQLGVATRRLARVWLGGGPTRPAPAVAGFRRGLEAVLERAPAGLVADHVFAELPADRPPWLDTGLRVSKGDRLTLLSVGRVWLSRPLDLWTPPAFQLWARVGEGRILRGTRDTHTFAADADGSLHLASHPPGEWADDRGQLATPPEQYAASRGGLCVLAIRWACEPEAGLRALTGLGAEAAPFADELARLCEPDPTPDGWRYLWFLGPAEIYRREREGQRDTIACRTAGDVGILQRDVALPLADDTRLRWSWRVERLPSDLPEDTPASHDYLSIAVEFENGRDITYTWSCSLPPETGYACPLPNWTARETHVVIRSGRRELGTWLDEERSLRADYARFIGEPPQRIVRVWLIANSLFQRREGLCRYADIAIVDGTGSHPVR